nr:hypothetical protein GCM10020092_101530 [Actinoplanes digitatis]
MFGVGFDAFGDEHGAGFAGEGGQGAGEGGADGVGVDVSDEGDVEFDDVGAELQYVAEAGVADARRRRRR